ncbi:MAG: cob(I)yrinic acid a,c-diamide adenosyltransferase, partial [Chloroflexi bacterium]|nr:cob(I)yrinic acid a,c-diamide adenosyltransferase [Chloroflexota bacterium]
MDSGDEANIPCAQSARNGLVQVYTGDGKGKTTAALGLALRASGQCLRVCVFQFMKGSKRCGEHQFAERYGAFDVVQPGQGSYFSQSAPQRLAAARQALTLAKSLISSGRYDLLVLDEILAACHGGLLSSQDIIDIIAARPPGTELILTGRGATPEVIAAADLVTEMVPVKHPYAKGIRARKGI